MSDLSNIYSGVIEYNDPDIIIATVPNTFFWQPRRKLYLPEPVRALIRTNNELSVSTEKAVKIPYILGEDRDMWLVERIKAVDERVKLIKKRTDALLSKLGGPGNALYDALSEGVKLAVTAVPVVGPLVSGIIGNDQAQQKKAVLIEQFKIQELLKDYTADLGELAKIRIALTDEYNGSPVMPSLNKNTGNIFSSIPIWYYYAVTVLVVVAVILITRTIKQNRKIGVRTKPIST